MASFASFCDFGFHLACFIHNMHLGSMVLRFFYHSLFCLILLLSISSSPSQSLFDLVVIPGPSLHPLFRHALDFFYAFLHAWGCSSDFMHPSYLRMGGSWCSSIHYTICICLGKAFVPFSKFSHSLQAHCRDAIVVSIDWPFVWKTIPVSACSFLYVVADLRAAVGSSSGKITHTILHDCIFSCRGSPSPPGTPPIPNSAPVAPSRIPQPATIPFSVIERLPPTSVSASVKPALTVCSLVAWPGVFHRLSDQPSSMALPGSHFPTISEHLSHFRDWLIGRRVGVMLCVSFFGRSFRPSRISVESLSLMWWDRSHSQCARGGEMILL